LTRFGETVAPGLETVYEGEQLYSGRSDFQQIDVYQHEHFGRVLTLDGLIQTTEADEFCYHEMLVHPALASRDVVASVLIIGGGDGGTLRHVLMHAPARVVMCEIDEQVVKVCRDLLPGVSDGAFDDPRAEVIFGDGAAFVRESEGAFDAIVVDGSDAVGPATVLFSEEFYAACRRALRPGGVFVSQTGSPMFQVEEFELALRNLTPAFPSVEPYIGFVPTYPGAFWSYMSATDGPAVSGMAAGEIADRLASRAIDTRYYTPSVHAGAFALPAFVEQIRERTAPASVPGR
jgi:spermidine synthase